MNPSKLRCGVPALQPVPATFILYGFNVPPGGQPWMSSLQRLNGDHFCGASLIDHEWAVTAHHCIDDRDANSFQLAVGATDLNNFQKEGFISEIREIISAPEAVSSNDWIHADVALLRLARSVPFSDTIRPICLAPSSRNVKLYRSCFISGWGLDEVGDEKQHLQGTTVSIIHSPEECSEIFGKLFPNGWSETGLCVDNENPNSPACNGDSGGPLVCQNPEGVWELVGVTSYGYSGCSTPGYPAVYQNVPGHFTKWIEKTIGKDLDFAVNP
ncbi:chymotrypsinogen B-like [Ylistrum balloti]|uniref:chymotrypsinogen B-like n=1 Tax=Ylistrum balloti TaxID=509963 RepID=UPI002905D1CE|nr:chymotrypsinogen B-like [Ylistrum balloti]